MPTIGSTVPPLKPPGIFACAEDTTLCSEEYVYRGDVTLRGKARDWRIFFSLCCPPLELDNFDDNSNLRVECGINNLDFPDAVHKNKSPIFHSRRPNTSGYPPINIINYPVLAVCEYRDYELHQNAIEFQGDSVFYELILPLTDSNTNINYPMPMPFNAPYSKTYVLPHNTLKPLTLDGQTGELLYSPVIPPNLASIGDVRMFQLAIKASEFRYDTFFNGTSMVWEARRIGYIIRNLNIITTDSSLCPDISFSLPSVVSPSLQPSCAGSVITLPMSEVVQCSSIDADASMAVLYKLPSLTPVNLRMAWGSLCSINTDTVFIQTDTNLLPGDYLMTLAMGNDGNTLLSYCSLELPAYSDTFFFEVDSIHPGHMRGQLDSNNVWGTDIKMNCLDTSFKVNFSEKIFCPSISTDSSEFELLDLSSTPYKIIKIRKVIIPACNKNELDELTILPDDFMPVGNYLLRTKAGSDGDIFKSGCGEMWPEDSIIVIVKEYINVALGPDRIFCEGAPINEFFSANQGYKRYLWTTGNSNYFITAIDTGTYGVTVWDTSGCSGSDSVRVYYIDCTGQQEYSLSEFDAYPNPNQGRLFYSQQRPAGIRVDLFDVFGRIILQQVDLDKTDNLDLNALKPGVYLLVAHYHGQKRLMKIVIE